MKKISKLPKKLLSLFIALIMVFSALPFTPPISAEAATEAELQSLRNEITLTKVNNLRPEVFNANGYFVNDVATGGFDNLLYCSNEVQYGEQAWNDTVQFRPDIPTYVVMAYDGVSDVGFPIVGEVKKSGYSPKVEYFGITNTSDFELRHLWYGYLSNDWTHWPNKNSSSFNEDFGWDASNVNTYSPGTTTTYFNNEIYYKGTGNYTDFYDFIDGTIKFLGKKNNYNAVTFSNTGAKQYVLNYKPIYDIISGKSTNLVMLPTSTGYTNSSMTFKGLFEYINNNPNRFTVDSQVAYYKAVKTICNMRVAGEFLNTDDSTVDSNVKAAAKVIKNAYNNYNNAVANLVRQYEVKFVSNDGTENISYYPVNTAGNIVVLPENTSSNYDSTHRYSYSWPSVQNVTKDAEYKEVETKTPHTSKTVTGKAATCTETGLTDGAVCSVCGYVITAQQTIPALGHNYTNVQKTTIEQEVDNQKRILQKHKKTCSRCNDVLVEDHKLTISGTEATCLECDYSVESGYTSNGFRITKGNLFDFDAYATNEKSITSVQDNGVDKAAVSVDTDNDTITVAGNAYDAYTNYGPTSDFYRIEVKPGNTYTLSYIPSTLDNQAFAFFSDGTKYLNANDPEGVETTWNRADYNATAKEEHKMTFIAPENCEYVDFRFGTVNSGAICTFSNISFYESDLDGNPTNGYKVLASGVTSGSKVLESLENIDIPSANVCKASYAMTEKEGRIGKEDLIYTNLNITLDTEHNYPNSLVIDGNKGTITCSECNYSYTLDLTAYNSAVKQAQASIADVKVYKNTSITELSNVLTEQEKVFSSAKTQDDVDSCANAIVTANKIKDGDNGGLLEYLTYNVTFIIQDGTDSKPVIVNEPHHYGDIVNMNVDEGNVYKWTKTTINSEDKPVEIKYADNATSTSYVVHENATIIAYLSPEQEASTNNVKIILKDKTDRISGIAYATNGTITLNDTYITVGDTKLYSKSVTYYNAKGYTINGVVVSGEYTIPEGVTEIVLRPIYIAGSTFQIDCDAATSINGKNVTSYQAKWDEPITIKASGEVIWYTKSGEKEIILAQGDTYKFRANESIKIYTKDVPQTNVAPSAKIGYFDYDVELNKVTVVNNFFVPSGMTVKSAGVILSTKTNDIETLKKQTSGHFSVTPDKFTENGNQVRISVSRTANNAFTMHALAYVEFQDGTVCYADEIATCQYSPKQA